MPMCDTLVLNSPLWSCCLSSVDGLCCDHRSLFFRDYHVDLCHVLRSLLVPDTGRALLLAPTRGGSLAAFQTLLKGTPSTEQPQPHKVPEAVGLEATLLEHYDEQLSRQHQRFLEEHYQQTTPEAALYAPDLHYPLLLTVRLCKEHG